MIDVNSVDTSRSALLIMHYQADVFAALFDDGRPDLLNNINALIGKWRSIERPVIFANFALGDCYEMANSNNQLISSLVPTGLFRQPTPVSGLDIRSSDPLYSCPRVNVFHGTSLDPDLRELGVETLVIAGITTTGVVFSSIGYASDADYKIHIVKQCCFDPDSNAHEALFRTSLKTRTSII